jgi:uncharacterized protein YndB with AHSA1/START domain
MSPVQENAAADKSQEKDLELEFTRVFHAPREIVFEAWTDAAGLARWFGRPHGCTTPVCEADARPGGAYRMVIRMPDGEEYPLKGVFCEVDRPRRLVMTLDVSEYPAWFHAEIRRLGGVGSTHPEAIVLTVTFDDENGATRLRVRSRFREKGDRDAHVKMGAPHGWSQSFEQLAALLGARMETR